MSKFLSHIEELELRKLHRNITNRKTCDRIKAILLLNSGYSAQEISEILLINDDTVRNWKNRFLNKKNMTSWLQDNFRVRTCDLTSSQLFIVEEYITNNIINDSKQVITFIEDQFGVSYSTAGMVSLLHRIGYEYKNTTLIPSKYDRKAQEECKKEYEKLSDNLKDDEVILFGDGVHPQHNTKTTKAWIKKGKNRNIKSNTGRQRVSIHGAYNAQNQDTIIHEDKTLNAENTITFFQKIEKYYADKSKIYIYLDNARYYKNAQVIEYLENSKIEVIFLPPYSPNLNLIERLWKFLRKIVINNKYYEKFALFKNAVMEFFEDSEKYREKLASFIGVKMQLLKN